MTAMGISPNGWVVQDIADSNTEGFLMIIDQHKELVKYKVHVESQSLNCVVHLHF